ncbi:hypothetical protein [Emticicia sp. 17c]|uniref:beta-xylosidase family glycoside hydrolase n=1 Tax=Emticicia sp. 17c TaxID=3127704 RepID=UPI00301CCB81
MSSTEERAFFRLFHEAYEKCFWHSLEKAMSETESKRLSNEIQERTGLVVGWKSIKNYSLYVLAPTTTKPENPSTATLDTLARYIANAPKTDESARKKNDSHYPYWHNYRDNYTKATKVRRQPRKLNMLRFKFWDLLVVLLLVLSLSFYFIRHKSVSNDFSDDFNNTQQDSLTKKGWFLKTPDQTYWSRRSEKAGHLTLFTLAGDNYPDTSQQIGIKNLLLREIKDPCFSTEIHLSDFIPEKNWQQVGLLLMEDTTFSSKSIRLSLSFNNFFGGYKKPSEILIQAISATNGNYTKPEEIAHKVIFSNEPSQESIVRQNLQKSALRIEKINHTYRFLYATGSNDLFAFKEIISRDLHIEPKYIGIFALKGFVTDTPALAAHIDFFSLKAQVCE